jgi:hypothetical protein
MFRAGRLAPLAFLGLAGLSFVLKIATAAGMPAWPLTAAVLLSALVAVLAAAARQPGSGFIDGWRALLALTVLWFLPSVYPRIGGDGVEYYVLIRSPLLDGDFDFANDFAAFDYTGTYAKPGGPSTARVGIGTGLFWLPFFLGAHAVVKGASLLGAPIAADGFSPLYQAATTAGTYLYGVLALFFLEAALRRWYSPAVATLTVLSLWLATPLYFYTVANPFMSHGISAFAATVFVLAWLAARRGGDPKAWALAGIAGGLMSLVRAHDSVLLIAPLADIAFSAPKGKLRRASFYLAPPAAMGILQLLVWRLLYGPGFAGTVAEMSLIGQQEPHLVDLLLSPRHGLFTWTPLYLAAVAGWAVWIGRDRRLGLLLAFGFGAAALLNSSFWDWWGADAFGQRRLLGLTPLFALGLGETLEFLRRRPLVLTTAGLAALIAWNLQFAYIYNSEILGRRDAPVSFERLAAAQVEVASRRLFLWADRLPAWLWVILYDNLKGIWLDEGTRSLEGRIDLGAERPDLPILVGAGWFEAEHELGTSLRRSRGPRSSLSVPIRSSGAFQATLRARLDYTAAPEPVTVELAVNGTPVGRAELTREWKEHEFSIDKRLIRPGLNTLLLTYSLTPRQVDPDFRGRNAVAAIDYLALSRTDRSGAALH